MIAGIIAAGEGSRLSSSHPGVVKPLVPVAGRPLAHWIVGGLKASGAQKLTVLTNSRGTAVPPSLSAAFPELTFDFMRADTASSFESFRLVARRLAESAESFLISTVDALILPSDVGRFFKECAAAHVEAGLALTDFVDDEKPLWANVDESGLTTAVGVDAEPGHMATCGLYYMTRTAVERLPEAATHARLRDFWTDLVRAKTRVAGVVLTKTLDVDRPEDVAAAENFLAAGKNR
jgi:NDP-sugar pyrophosphorylase family protein